MKEIWCTKVAIIQNVEFCKAAPLGVKGEPMHNSHLLLYCHSSALHISDGIKVMKLNHYDSYLY